MLKEIDQALHEFIPPPEPVKGKKSYKKLVPALLAAALLTCGMVTAKSPGFVPPAPPTPPIVTPDSGISVSFVSFSSSGNVIVNIEEPERVEELTLKIIDRYRGDLLLDELSPEPELYAEGQYSAYLPLYEYVEYIEKVYGPIEDVALPYVDAVAEARFKGESSKKPVASASIAFTNCELWPLFQAGELKINIVANIPIEGLTEDKSQASQAVIAIEVEGIDFELGKAKLRLESDFGYGATISMPMEPPDKPFTIYAHTVAIDINDNIVPWTWRAVYDPATGFFN